MHTNAHITNVRVTNEVDAFVRWGGVALQSSASELILQVLQVVIPRTPQLDLNCMEAEGTEVESEANVEPQDKKTPCEKYKATQLVCFQKPDGVKTFMSQGLSLCGHEVCHLASVSEISIWWYKFCRVIHLEVDLGVGAIHG